MNSTSERPINIAEKQHGDTDKVSFADVAMRVARDGPMYGVIILVGILALRGTLEGLQAVMGAALALQARSYPSPIQMGSAVPSSLSNRIGLGAALVAGGFILSQAVACVR